MVKLRTPLPRDHWQHHEATLDLEQQWAKIYGIAMGHEFPWDNARATEFALFRTFAVPEIGELLQRTGAFTKQTQKRYDDTTIIIDEAGLFIYGETEDRTAIRRVNQMHGSYDIPNDQMVYVLTTFVVPSVRWIERYGYRPLNPLEVESAVRYWQRMGELMGLRDVPEDYAAFEAFYDAYERERFAYSPGGREVADATLNLFVEWYSPPLRPMVRAMAIALMDPELRRALRYGEPSALASRLLQLTMAARKRILRRLPARRTPVRAVENWRIKSYPDGWNTAEVGTFPQRDAPVAEV